MTATESEIPSHLQGNGAPVSEELTLTNLDVTGTSPPELDGRYLRNGANPFTGMSDHPFLGDGMIHGVRLRDGNAEWYRNRYVKTPFITDPDRPVINVDSSLREMDSSKANTHVVGHAGKILALEEGHFPYVLDGDLNTVGPTDYDGELTGPFTAHPKICPETGELLLFGYSSLPPYLVYHRVDASGALVQSTEITVNGPTMMHDFAVSRNHSIFMDLPMIFDMELAMSGGMPIRWSDDYPARFGVMPRTGEDADVQWFDIDPCYIFHTLNAHDDGDDVVLQALRIRELWRQNAEIGSGDSDPADLPMMWEWRLNRSTGKVTERQLDDRSSEFPRVPDAKAGFEAQYGYTMSQTPDGAAGEIFKYDFGNDAARSVHTFPVGHTPGEPVFVPADGATNEDDGYLMTYVHQADTDTSYLVVLDATDMPADPVAEVHLPTRVPAGFHGSWVAD